MVDLFSTWGYTFVFAGVFLESLFFTGWLAPGTAVLLAGGFFASKGDLNVVAILVIAVVGAFAGDSLGYLIGIKSGRGLVSRFEDRFKMRERVERVQSYFDKYGGVTVLFARLVSGVDAFVPLAAGMGHMNYGRYAAFDLPAIAVWATAFVIMGYLSGENWERIENAAEKIGWGLIGIAVALLVGIYVARLIVTKVREPGPGGRKRGSEREDAGDEASDVPENPRDEAPDVPGGCDTDTRPPR